MINPYRYAGAVTPTAKYEWLASDIGQGDETNIATWTDGIDSKTFTQGTGTAQPVFDTSLSGRNAVKFPSASGGDWMSSASNSKFTIENGESLEVDLYIASDTTMYVLSCNNADVNAGYRMIYDSATNKMRFLHDGLGIDISSPSISLNTWYTIKIDNTGSTTAIYRDATIGDSVSNSSDLTCSNDMYLGTKSWSQEAGTSMQDGSGVSMLRWNL